MSPLLAPRQMGAGISGGAEAMVFTNAFNKVRRDSMLESVAQDLPELFNHVSSSYLCPSSLWFGEYILSSEEGVQQGDPLGLLLFSLSLSKSSRCDLTICIIK